MLQEYFVSEYLDFQQPLIEELMLSGQRKPGCQYRVQEQDNSQIFHQNTLQENVRLKNCEAQRKFTFRKFLSYILHEGFNLEVVICEIVFHKTHSEHDTGDFAAVNRWAQIRSLCHPSV